MFMILVVCVYFIGNAIAQEKFAYNTNDNGDVSATIRVQVGCHVSQSVPFELRFDSIGLSTLPEYHQTSRCVTYNASSNLVDDVIYIDKDPYRSKLTLLNHGQTDTTVQPHISVPTLSSALKFGIGVCDTTLITTGLPQHCRHKIIATGQCDSNMISCYIIGTRDTDGKPVKIGIQYSHNKTYATGDQCKESSYTTAHGYQFNAPCETAHQSTLKNVFGVDVMMSVHDQQIQIQYERYGLTVYKSTDNNSDIANIVFILSLILVLATFLPTTMSISKERESASVIDSSLYIRKIRVIIFDISASITFCACISVLSKTCYTLFDSAAERFEGVEFFSIPIFLLLNVFGFGLIARVLMADMIWEYQEKLSNNSDKKLDSVIMQLLVKIYIIIPNEYLKDRRMHKPDCYVLVRQIFECQILTTIHAFVPGVMVNRLKSLFGVMLGTAAVIICGRDFIMTSGTSRIYSGSFSCILLLHTSINMFLPMLIIADSHALHTYGLAFVLPAALSFHGFCAGIITAYIQTKNAEVNRYIQTKTPS